MGPIVNQNNDNTIGVQTTVPLKDGFRFLSCLKHPSQAAVLSYWIEGTGDAVTVDVVNLEVGDTPPGGSAFLGAWEDGGEHFHFYQLNNFKQGG